MNSRDRLQPKFPAWVESRVAISGRSATAWVFAATSACFRVVIFNRFMSAIGESCRYAPAKGRKMPDRLPDAQRSQRLEAQGQAMSTILGLSGLADSVRFKREHWPALEEREYRICRDSRPQRRSS